MGLKFRWKDRDEEGVRVDWRRDGRAATRGGGGSGSFVFINKYYFHPFRGKVM